MGRYIEIIAMRYWYYKYKYTVILSTHHYLAESSFGGLLPRNAL